MKHTWTVTFLFLAMFLAAQLLGLYLVGVVTNISVDNSGQTQVDFTDTALIERPQLQGVDTVIYIVIGVGIGTLLLLLLAKTRKVNLWRIWFMLAVWLAMTLSLGVMLRSLHVLVPVIVAAALTYLKVYRPNIYIQNITEILTYSGIAVLLVPILNVWYAILILVLFSVYDAYAVWKSKHMVTLAKFTTQANLFPGLSIPYSVKRKKTVLHSNFEKPDDSIPAPPSKSEDGRKTGILGGGDVVFPLMFAGAVMLDLIGKGFSKPVAFSLSLVVVFGALASLVYLFIFARKDRFYPAMPYLTAGCMAGFGLMWLGISVLS